jgi:putative redox protein
MRNEKVTFPGSAGTPLAGRLDLPDARPRAFAMFAHCFTCSKEVLAASRIAQALTGYGIAVLRFDFTGLGGSGGDFANTNFTSNVADLVNAADYLRSNHAAPTILVGHSLGGAAVLAAAEHIPEARAVATIGAPAGTEHLLDLLGESRQEIEETGEVEICLAARPFRIRRQFLEDISDQPQADRIRRLGAALLVMHSCSPESPTPASLPRCWRLGRADISTRTPRRPPTRRTPPPGRGLSRGWSSCPKTVEARTDNTSQPAGTC